MSAEGRGKRLARCRRCRLLPLPFQSLVRSRPPPLRVHPATSACVLFFTHVLYFVQYMIFISGFPSTASLRLRLAPICFDIVPIIYNCTVLLSRHSFVCFFAHLPTVHRVALSPFVRAALYYPTVSDAGIGELCLSSCRGRCLGCSSAGGDGAMPVYGS